MMTQPDVNKLIRQTRQYEFSDGLRDLQMALLLGIGGMAVWLTLEPMWITFVGNMVKVFGRWAAWISLLPAILAPLTAWGMLRLMDYLRQRWLWRESGMVKSARWIVPRRVNVLSAVILLGGLALGLGLKYLGRADDSFVLRMFWAATGWAFGYTLAGVGRQVGLSRYVWLGVAGGLVSTVMLFLPLSFGQSALVFGLSWGLLLMVSGIVTLRRVMPSVKDGQ
jgi:hypothetical protein